VARVLGGAPEAATRNIFRVAGSAGVLRWVGVGGGLLSTGLGMADLISQGNPIEAFRNDPSGYTSDLTGTIASATMTYALCFPTPASAIVAGVAAGIYGGALIWDNWDHITGWGQDAWAWTTDAWDTTTDWVDDTASDIGGTVRDAADSVRDTAVDTVTDATDTARDAAGDFIEGAGDVVGGLF
jgi:hypothetical protein